MSEGCFKEKHICPSIKILIHAIPQTVQAGVQIVYVGSVNTPGLIGTSGVLV